jgi:hypothetical protein
MAVSLLFYLRFISPRFVLEQKLCVSASGSYTLHLHPGLLAAMLPEGFRTIELDSYNNFKI